MDTHSQSIKFIGHFLQWYQNSYSQPDVVNHIKLVELVKEAEDIHTAVVKEKMKEYDKRFKEQVVSSKDNLLEEVYRANLNKKNRKKKRISKFL